MREVVVMRPMLGIIYVKCPFCNLEAWLDRSGTLHSGAKFKCETCGALFGEYLVGIQTLRNLIDNDELKDDDTTAVMSDTSVAPEKILLAGQVSPTVNMKMERSVFYVATVVCPFCEHACATRYNATQPHLAQWCPECHAELVTTIWAELVVSGNLTDWYHSEEG